MVFSCLEVILNGRAARKQGKLAVWCEDKGEKNRLSYLYSCYLFACCSTHAWHEGKYRGNLSKWDNSAALVVMQERNTQHGDKLTVWMREWLVYTEQKRTSIYQITKAEREEIPGKKSALWNMIWDMELQNTNKMKKSIILLIENCSSKAAGAASDTERGDTLISNCHLWSQYSPDSRQETAMKTGIFCSLH